MMKALKELEIYVHIPFCVRKCNYCDFLSFSASDKDKEEYVEDLIKEIRGMQEKYQVDVNDYTLRSIYLGGGTPSILKGQQIKRIMEALYEIFNIENNCINEIEITLEVNPATATLDKLVEFKAAGINRISLGLQSAQNNELEMLGRVHRFNDFEDTFRWARLAGFENVNVDIMTAIPGQSIETLISTINTVVSLNPEHISAYSLILEEGTPFYDMYGDGDELFTEEEERNMYHRCCDMLKEKGYEHYEISNYAKKGYESRHNTGYWKGISYIGVGLGASSYVNGIRYKNTNIMENYILNPTSIDDFTERLVLSDNDKIEEFMFLGLRMLEGVKIRDGLLRLGVAVDEIYKDIITKLNKEGLIGYDCDRIWLTDKGIDYGNYVFSQFLLNRMM